MRAGANLPFRSGSPASIVEESVATNAPRLARAALAAGPRVRRSADQMAGIPQCGRDQAQQVVIAHRSSAQWLRCCLAIDAFPPWQRRDLPVQGRSKIRVLLGG
jgi:hypothetical protein